MMYDALIAVVVIIVVIIIITITVIIIIIEDQPFCYSTFSSNKARILLIVLGFVSHKPPRLTLSDAKIARTSNTGAAIK
jgi:hypothetical protein